MHHFLDVFLVFHAEVELESLAKQLLRKSLERIQNYSSYSTKNFFPYSFPLNETEDVSILLLKDVLIVF